MKETMNLSEKCHHCGADIGKLCKESCKVNGDIYGYIKKIADRMEIKADRIVKLLEREATRK